MKNWLLFICICTLTLTNHAQVGIGTTMPDPSAQLDISATDKGILIPNVALLDVSNTMLDGVNTAATGLLIYNTNPGTVGGSGVGYYYFNGLTWERLSTAAAGGSDSDWYEVGTTAAPGDINDDIFTQGNVAIGKVTADHKLDIEETNGGDGIGVVMSGATNNNINGISTEITNSGNGNQIGLLSELSGVGNGSHYGSYKLLSGIGDGAQYGDFTAITNSGNSIKLGYDLRISGNTTSTVRGYQSVLSSGDGYVNGLFTNISSNGNGTQEGMNILLQGNGNGFHYGIRNEMSGSGSGQKYALYTDISASGNGTHYANYSQITGNGSGVHYGSSNLLVGSGGGSQYGLVSAITNSGDGAHHGLWNSLSGDGIGVRYGTLNSISGTGNGERYGTYSRLTGNNNAQNIAAYHLLDVVGSGDHLGVQTRLSGIGNGIHTGVHNMFNGGGSGLHQGVYNFMNSGGSGQHMGIRNILGGAGTNIQSGVHNTITNISDGIHQGVVNYLNGQGNGPHYGTSNNLNGIGSGNKYGSYNLLNPAAGGNHYGVYSEVLKPGGYAAYLLGDLSIGTTPANSYILPASRGTLDQVMQSDGAGNISWVDPASLNSTNALNGLTLSGNNITLGGTLTQTTVITADQFSLDVNLNDPASGSFSVSDDGVEHFSVNHTGLTFFGDDTYWRDGSTGGTNIALLTDEGDDGRLRIYENGTTAIDLNANTQSVFNEQGLDRNFRVESDTNANMLFVDAGTDRIGIGVPTPATSLHVEHIFNVADGLSISNVSDADRWHFYVFSSNDLYMYFNNAARGRFDDVSGNYTALSDRRLKSNITEVAPVLDRVKALTVVDYNFKHQEDAKKYLGFIAQDVEQLFPQLVKKPSSENGEISPYMLDYAGFGTIAIKAIQEQQDIIEHQQSEIDLLKQELAAIKAMILQMKN